MSHTGKPTTRGKARTAIRPAKREALPERANELLAAALELFSEQDFTAVTIKDIANSIGVNTALIYYYFEDKADLFRASLEYAVERALANYRRLGERHSNPVDLIADWFENHVELVNPIRQLVKIMLDYSTSRAKKTMVDDAIQRFYVEECRILSGAVRRGIKMGAFRQVNPERAAHIASTYLDGIMVRSLIHRDLDIPAAMMDLKELFWEHLGYEEARGIPAHARKNKLATVVARARREVTQ